MSSSKHDLDTIELKWGQGAKCIGGEIKVEHSGARPGAEAARLHRHPRPDAAGDSSSLHGWRHQGVRAPLAVWASSTGGLPGRDRHGCGIWASSASRSRPAPTPCGSWPWPCATERGQDRPADHRRRPGRHRHEPLADDERVGHPNILPPDVWPSSSPASYRRAACECPTWLWPAASPLRTDVFKALAMGAPYVKAVCMGRPS